MTNFLELYQLITIKLGVWVFCTNTKRLTDKLVSIQYDCTKLNELAKELKIPF